MLTPRQLYDLYVQTVAIARDRRRSKFERRRAIAVGRMLAALNTRRKLQHANRRIA